MSSKSKSPGRHYKVRGLATRKKRRKGSPGGSPTRSQTKILVPPGGSWWNAELGKLKDAK